MRTVSLYVVLVGLPLLGLLAVLRAGQAITPPPSIGGEWVLEASDVPSACLGLSGSRLSLTIVQSGLRSSVVLGAGGPLLDVELRGDSLVSRPLATTAGCQDAPPALRAALALQPGREPTMAGVLHRPGCAGCVPLAFTAARRDAPTTAP